MVRDHVPLKQGLRHCLDCISVIETYQVRDHVPLKQGLRHQFRVQLQNSFEESETMFHSNKD